MSQLERLRPYQREAHDAVISAFNAGATAALLHIVMGGGKTETAFAIIESMGSALFLVNRVDLVMQTATRYGHGCGVYCASLNQKTVRRVTFASPQSVKDLKGLPPFPLVVVDEAHRCTGEFRKLVETLQAQGSKVLGLSATPWPVMGKGEMFERATFTFGIQAGIAQGFLVRPRMRGSVESFDPRELSIKAGEYDAGELAKLVAGEEKVRRQIQEALTLTSERQCLVWATANIKHCEMVARLLRERNETAHAFHSDLTMSERKITMDEFKQGAIRHLVFVTIVSEGFDHPPIDTVVLMRPTRSVVLAIQTVGRCLRLSPGKTDALVLDYGRVFEAIGPIDAPRLPKKGERAKDAYKLPPFKFCPACYSYVARAETSCPECKLVFMAPTKMGKGYDPKNLDPNARLSDLMSDELITRSMRVGSVTAATSRSKANRMVIILKYFPEDLLADPITEYLTLGEVWLLQKTRTKLRRFGFPNQIVEQIMKSPSLITHMKIPVPESIRYTMRGHYPEVSELIFPQKETHEISAALPASTSAQA